MKDELFQKCFDRIFDNEGGYQNNANDRGNWTGGEIGKGECRGTKFGISAMSYPDLNIRNLTLEQARKIYYDTWWRRLNLHQFDSPAICYQIFDAAINHGMQRTVKLMQLSLKIKCDGIIGKETISTLANIDVNDFLFLFLSNRLFFMSTLSNWNTFGRGWARRIAHNLEIASRDN